MKESMGKKLSEIEFQLTPKEWAIGLADEMRRHPSAAEFMKSAAKEARFYRELPYVKPFHALKEQARRAHPGEEQKDLHAKSGSKDRLQQEYQLREDLHAQDKLNEKLRCEYHMLKLLVCTSTTRSRIERIPCGWWRVSNHLFLNQ